MPKISGLGAGEIKKISGLGAGAVKKVSGLGLGLIWQESSAVVARRTTNGTAIDVSPNGATSLSLNYPSGSSSGDLIIAQIFNEKSSASPARTVTVTGGATWTLLSFIDDSAVGLRYLYYWAFRGSEAGITVTTTGGFDKNIGISMLAYDGSTVDSTVPVYEGGSVYAAGGGTTQVTASYVPTTGCDIALFSSIMQANNVNMSQTWTNATELADYEEQNASTTVDHGLSIAVDTQPSVGLSATHTATSAISVLQRTLQEIVVVPVGTSFPYTVTWVVGSSDTTAASVNISMPSSTTGDLLFCEVVANGAVTPATASSGWTKLGQYQNASGDTLAIFIGISGTANSTLAVSGGSVHRAWNTRVIRNWSGTLSNIEAASTTGNSTNPNPPSLTPTLGSRRYLWIAIGVAVQGSSWPTVPPTGFGDFAQSRCSATASTTHVGFADSTARLEGTTIDPGTFTATTQQWVAATVAIPA